MLRQSRKNRETKVETTTHGRNLFDRAGGKRDAFEYVDWVVAHKRLLEALWDSAMEATAAKADAQE